VVFIFTVCRQELLQKPKGSFCQNRESLSLHTDYFFS
jgi:hypothetical protein